MRLSTLGPRNVVAVASSTTVRDVANTLAERNVGSVLVMNRGHLLGIVTFPAPHQGG
jgi:CBS domain-containing protein